MQKKKKNFTVILDGDDVLYRCNEEAVALLNRQKGTHYTIDDITQWGAMNCELDERLRFFNEPDFVRRLSLMDGAKEFVARLSDRAEILIMTDVPTKCIGARIESILRDFGDFISPDNIIIGHRKDKIVGDMLIDDCVHHLMNSQAKYPVLFMQPWNYEQSSSLLSVSGYTEIIQLVDTIKSGEFRNPETEFDAVCLIGPPGVGKKQACSVLTQNPMFEKVTTFSTKEAAAGYHHISVPDFKKAQQDHSFFETSMYMGDFYGTKMEDVRNVWENGHVPVLIVDINGAMKLKAICNAVLVFITAQKDVCIMDILQRDLSLSDKTKRLVALDSEFDNEVFCDLVITKDDITQITQMFQK